MMNRMTTLFVLMDLSLRLMVVRCRSTDGGLISAERSHTSCSLNKTCSSGASSANSLRDGNDGVDKSSNCVDDCVCPENKICVRKCCPSNQVLEYGTTNASTKCATRSNGTGHAHFWHYVAYSEFKGWTNLSSFENVHVIYGRPCKTSYHLNPYKDKEDDYLLVGNGSLINQNMAESRYCVDYVEKERFLLPLLCSDGDEEGFEGLQMKMERTLWEEIERYTKLVGLSISIVFLLLTFLVYAVVPSLQNLQGKNLLCHVFSLMVAYSGLLAISSLNQLSIEVCITSAFVVQFSFLASFFWLNTMCFDLWYTFSGYRSFNGSPKERDLKKFLAYCLYAWGCPTLIVAVTIFVEFYPHLPENFIRPEFGKSKCFFETNGAIFIYFYGFISVIVFSNLCMFISTMSILKKHKKEAKVFKRSGSRRHLDHDKQRFNLYLKLFIVMGVNWIMEVVSFYFPAFEKFWLVTDIGNTLQGVLIFLMFVCKRRILILLNKRLLPHHPLLNRPKKNASTVTSVISLASVRGAGIVVSSVSKPPPQVTHDMQSAEENKAC